MAFKRFLFGSNSGGRRKRRGKKEEEEGGSAVTTLFSIKADTHTHKFVSHIYYI